MLRMVHHYAHRDEIVHFPRLQLEIRITLYIGTMSIIHHHLIVLDEESNEEDNWSSFRLRSELLHTGDVDCSRTWLLLLALFSILVNLNNSYHCWYNQSTMLAFCKKLRRLHSFSCFVISTSTFTTICLNLNVKGLIFLALCSWTSRLSRQQRLTTRVACFLVLLLFQQYQNNFEDFFSYLFFFLFCST